VSAVGDSAVELTFEIVQGYSFRKLAIPYFSVILAEVRDLALYL